MEPRAEAGAELKKLEREVEKSHRSLAQELLLNWLDHLYEETEGGRKMKVEEVREVRMIYKTAADTAMLETAAPLRRYRREDLKRLMAVMLRMRLEAEGIEAPELGRIQTVSTMNGPAHQVVDANSRRRRS